MIRWTLVLLAACGLMACGGGGGGGGGGVNASVFTGDYFIAIVSVEDTRETSVSWGTATANGVSQLSLSGSENKDGTVIMPSGVTVDYTIAPDGTMVISQGPTPLLTGAIRSDGGIAVLNSTDGPAIVVFLKTAGVYSAATATGAYGVVGFGAEVDRPAYASFAGTATFDGVSTIAATFPVLNVEGTISPASTGFGYTIASDGASTLSSGPYAYQGACAPGGDFVIFGGDTLGEPTASGSDPVIWAFVRRGAGLTDAVFSGGYRVVGAEFEISGTEASSFYGLLTADGAGGLSISGTRTAGGSTGPLAGTGSYTVGADGAFEVNRTGITERIQGSISPDGRYFIAGGGGETDANPVLWIGFRD